MTITTSIVQCSPSELNKQKQERLLKRDIREVIGFDIIPIVKAGSFLEKKSNNGEMAPFARAM